MGNPLVDQRFARNLRRIVIEMGLTISDFATLIGVKPNTLNGWINGRAYPKGLSVIYRIHRITGRSFDEILG